MKTLTKSGFAIVNYRIPAGIYNGMKHVELRILNNSAEHVFAVSGLRQ